MKRITTTIFQTTEDPDDMLGGYIMGECVTEEQSDGTFKTSEEGKLSDEFYKQADDNKSILTALSTHQAIVNRMVLKIK